MDKKKILITAVIVLMAIIAIVAIFLSKKNQPGQPVSCNLQNCPSGCCADDKCQTQGSIFAGYLCLGANNWQTPGRQVVTGAPKEVAAEVKKNAETDKISPNPASQRIEMAKKTLDWLNMQKDEKGLYSLYQIVRANGEVVPYITDSREVIDVVLARYAYWKKTKDTKTLDLLKQDLDVLGDEKKLPQLMPEFWHCKLFYEIWNDKLMPGDLKDKAKASCARSMTSGYPDVDLKSILSDTITVTPFPEKSIQELESALNKPEKNITLSPQEEEELQQKYPKYAAYVSDFLNKYQWEKKNQDLEAAKTFFSYALDAYKRAEEAAVIPQKECLLGIASLDFFKTTADDKYRSFAQKLWEKISISPKGSLFSQATCAIFTNEINTITPDKKYGDFLKNLTDEIIKNNHEINSGAFFYKSNGSIIKEIRDNCLLVKVLSDSDSE